MKKRLKLDRETIKLLRRVDLPTIAGGGSLHCTEVGHSLCLGVYGCSGAPNC